jgi:tetratricopeptide (TPR) repeat protein
MKKRVFLGLLSFLFVFPLSSLDFSFRPRAYALFPLGWKSPERYTFGGGGSILFDMDISSVLTNPIGLGYALGLEGGLGMATADTDDVSNFSLLEGGGGLSLFGYPLSRLSARLEAAAGAYQGVAFDSSISSWWGRAGAEVGFRFIPEFILSVSGGFKYYNDPNHDGPALSGFYAGLTAQINFGTGLGTGTLEAVLTQEEPVFPAMLSLYKQNPVGVIRISNRESAEVRNLRVSFRAGTYTSSEYACGTLPFIPRGRSAEISLFADFAPELLNFTDNGRILGELVIRYSLLGKERTVVRSLAVQVYNRNSFRWADANVLAAFISPTSQEILEYSKYVTGLARSHLRTGLDRNMQFGIYLFEGLREMGLHRGGSGDTPYEKYHAEIEQLDTVQFPFQTISYLTGDVDDLGILYAASLQAAGIRSSFIALEKDFILLLPLGINEGAVNSLFSDTARVLINNDEVLLPLSMAAFDDGFTAAWDRAMETLSEVLASSETGIDIIVPEDSWAVYPPANLPPREFRFKPPRAEELSAAADEVLARYIGAELEPKAEALRRELGRAPTAALYNQLGTVYVRSGLFNEANSAFTSAANMNSVAAMINLGGLYARDRDWAASERWYRRALELSPDNAAARRGLEQALEARED